MSGEPNQGNIQKSNEPKAKGDMVACIAKARIMLKRDGEHETYAEPGERIELSREDFNRLSKRSFDGYPSIRDTKWDDQGNCGGATVAPMPNFAKKGVVSDPIVEAAL